MMNLEESQKQKETLEKLSLENRTRAKALDQVNYKLEEDLGEAKQKLERVVEMEKSLAEEKGKLEMVVKRLKTMVSEAKNLDIVEFKEFEA